MACSSAVFTAAGNFCNACSSVVASIGNDSGSTPPGVSNCVCPENSTARAGSGAPSAVTGTRRRTVPALPSVYISSRYRPFTSISTSGNPMS